MLDLNKFIPKTIKNEKGNHEYRLHSTIDKIPEHNKKIKKDEIGIWYENRTPTDGRVIHYSVLPRFINEDKDLYKSIGLYLAEGGLDPHRLFSFGNDEPQIINTLMRSFQRHFEVPFSNWVWSIYFNNKLKKKENDKMTEQREKASINFWLENTEIKPELSSKTLCRYSNKNSRGKLRTQKKWGSLTIVYGNKVLKNLWLKIMDNLVKKTLRERNRNNAASILKGWIAGDGYCRYDVYDKPRRELGIVCTDGKKNQILYKLSYILGIKPYKGKNGLRFTKAKYLVRAYNCKLTSLHPKKHLNLLKSLLSYKRIPESIKSLNSNKIKEELSNIKKKIRERKKLFERLKDKKVPTLRKEINWQFLINGLLLEEGIDAKDFRKEIGCAKTIPGKWLEKGVKPSRKYKIKILEKVKKYDKEKLTKIGEFFLKGNWKYLLEGLQIFLKASRAETAKKVGIHVNTIESTINQRTELNRNTASKILNLIEGYGKTLEEILQIYISGENMDWSNRIKKILIENEWSQRELAEKIGCSRSLVREWLGGLEPTNKYKGKLLEILNIMEKTKFDFGAIIRELPRNSYISLDKSDNFPKF